MAKHKKRKPSKFNLCVKKEIKTHKKSFKAAVKACKS